MLSGHLINICELQDHQEEIESPESPLPSAWHYNIWDLESKSRTSPWHSWIPFRVWKFEGGCWQMWLTSLNSGNRHQHCRIAPSVVKGGELLGWQLLLVLDIVIDSPEPQNHPHPGPIYQVSASVSSDTRLWLTNPRQEEYFVDFCVYKSWGPLSPNSVWWNGSFFPFHNGKLMFISWQNLESASDIFLHWILVFPIEDKGPQLCSSHQGPKSSALSSCSSL